jgi:uncharacterized protein (TIGR01777 family)
MSKTILITGASGLIGRSLSRFLSQKGYRIYHLNRSESKKNPWIKTFKWDVYTGKIDENCINGVDTIIHLAGEGIADKPWSKKRKQSIIESRTKSIRLILDLLKKKEHQLKTIISASAIGYYGDRGNELLIEESRPGPDYLGQTCIAWEKAVDEGKELGLRIVKLRTGLVLTAEGGALPQLAKPVQLGVGAPLGSGKQWVSWIHLQDVLNMYHFTLENSQLSGAFNMTAPNPVTNSELTETLARELKKPLWLPSVPAFILRIILGKMSAVVLNSTRTSSQKIQSKGFEFKFQTLAEALKNIYGSKKTDKHLLV